MTGNIVHKLEYTVVLMQHLTVKVGVAAGAKAKLEATRAAQTLERSIFRKPVTE